jgi:chemotaxis methyl-accepting protein methylase
MNPLYLERGIKGIYTRTSLKEVPEEIRIAFFAPTADGIHFSVMNSLKEQIEWKQENLVLKTPEERFHLIFLRNNLLTYYDETIKAPVFDKVLGCLIEGGFLVIGAHERIPSGARHLTPFVGGSCILQKSVE